MKTKSKRKRVTAEQVQKHAKDGGGGGGGRWLRLPAGVEQWVPEKAGTYSIDVVPYEVSDSNHPDNVEKGALWYKRPLRVHRTESGSYVCPKSKDQDAQCDWCRQFFKLRKQGAEDDDLRPFKGQMIDAYNIRNPEDPEKFAVMPLSYGKFTKTLLKELEQTGKDNLLFFDVRKGVGRTLKVRFSEAKFAGQKYLEATRIDFKPRKSMDEDEVLSKVVDLDKALNVLDADKLHKIFLQQDEAPEDEAPEDDEEKRREKVKKRKAETDEIGDAHRRDLEDRKAKAMGGKKKAAKGKSDDSEEE